MLAEDLEYCAIQILSCMSKGYRAPPIPQVYHSVRLTNDETAANPVLGVAEKYGKHVSDLHVHWESIVLPEDVSYESSADDAVNEGFR